MSYLLIGDIHLKIKSVPQFESLKQKIMDAARSNDIKNIVFMGDLLDTHDIVRVSLHSLITNFIAELSNYKVFILIGNHDYSSPTQYLTSNHIFGPLKRWKNVWVVDEPLLYKRTLMLPYVPSGKFLDAIEGIKDYDRIFCHQSFLPLIKFSDDYWDPENPIKIYSGHIHDSCKNKNVFYTGSSLQTSVAERPEKYLWILNEKDVLKAYPLNIKGINTIKCTPDSLFNVVLSELHENRIVIRGKKEDYKNLVRKAKYKTLEQQTRIEWDYIEEVLTKEEKGHYKIDFRLHLDKMLTKEEGKFLENMGI